MNNQNDNEISNNFMKKRSFIIIYTIFFAFFILIIRSLYLSIIAYQENISYVNNQNEEIIRHDITDRNGNVLALDVSTFSVYIRPKSINNKEKVINTLVNNLNLSEDFVSNLVNSNSSFLWVKRNISKQENENLRLNYEPGIYFQKEKKRVYPYGSMFSHIVGITDIDGKGISGIEYSFNEELLQEDIILSVDLQMQRILHNSLTNAVAKNQAQKGYGIILDVKTSEVLAMVTLPDFNPNDRSEIDFNKMFNYPTQGLIEPGSISKVFSVAMALENGDYQIEDKIDVSKPIVYDSYVIVDFDYRDRALSIPEVLMYSSNIGTSIMMQKLGISSQIYYLNKFKLFQESSLEIAENAVPLTQNKWDEITSMTVSYGYGLALSQMTFLNAFSAIINDGIYIPATLIKREKEITNYRKERILSSSISKEINKILRLTVAYGSGKRADISGFSVAGKTGSAEKQVNGRYQKGSVLASFVSFFPYNDPKYAIIISIDEPKRVAYNGYSITGGILSAPVVGEIISNIATTYSLETGNNDTKDINVNNQETIINYVLRNNNEN